MITDVEKYPSPTLGVAQVPLDPFDKTIYWEPNLSSRYDLTRSTYSSG